MAHTSRTKSIEKECLECGNKFLSDGRTNFCSRKCSARTMWKTRRERGSNTTTEPTVTISGQYPLVTLSCPLCRREFQTTSRPGSGRKYCSEDCSRNAIRMARLTSPLERTCGNCGKDYSRRPGDPDSKYCTHACAVAANSSERETVNCLNCAKPFERRVQERRLRIYCSQECTWRHRATSPKHGHRCNDGHMVRSEPERLIDNWLDSHEVHHKYEPDIDGGFSDWKVGDTYIEYWGGFRSEDNARRKAEKLAIYAEMGAKLIELYPEDLENLDGKLRNISA